MIKKILFSVITIVVSFIIIAGAAEVVLRLVRGVPDNPLALIVQDENDNRVLCTPGEVTTSKSSVPGEFEYTFHINSHGYRGSEFSIKKLKGITRIMALGDSFTFGVGAEDDETYAVLLEKGLKKRGFPVQVINAGVGHASTIRHWDNLLKFHLKYHPDIVILFFDLTDLADDWNWEKHAVWNKDGTIKKFDLDYDWGKRRLWPTLVHHSALAKYLEDKVVRTWKKLRLLGLKRYLSAIANGERAKAVIIDSKGEYSDETMMEYDGLLMLRGRQQKRLIDENWKRTEKYLLKIRDLLAKRNIPLIIVMYPHGIYVGPDQWNEGRKTWGFEQGKQYKDYYPFELMKKFTDEAKIPFVNTLSGFLSAPKDKYFYDWDGHMTPAGNRIVVQKLLSNPELLNIIKKQVQHHE